MNAGRERNPRREPDDAGARQRRGRVSRDGERERPGAPGRGAHDDRRRACAPGLRTQAASRRADARRPRGRASRAPSAPACAVDRPVVSSSSVTTQLPTTTLSPNDAAKTTASRSSRRSRASAPSGHATVRRAPRSRTRAGRRPAASAGDSGDDDRARVRRPPAERPEQQRHDRERDAAACRGDTAVEALRERRSAGGAHVVAATDERERRARLPSTAARRAPAPGRGRSAATPLQSASTPRPAAQTRPAPNRSLSLPAGSCMQHVR